MVDGSVPLCVAGESPVPAAGQTPSEPSLTAQSQRGMAPGPGREAGSAQKLPQAQKNPSSALFPVPELERPHFHHGLHSGQFRCTLQRPQMGGEGVFFNFLCFPKLRLREGRRAGLGGAPAGVARAGTGLGRQALSRRSH